MTLPLGPVGAMGQQRWEQKSVNLWVHLSASVLAQSTFGQMLRFGISPYIAAKYFKTSLLVAQSNCDVTLKYSFLYQKLEEHLKRHQKFSNHKFSQQVSHRGSVSEVSKTKTPQAQGPRKCVM